MYPSISLLKVEAEVAVELSMQYAVEVVPTFVFLDENNKVQSVLAGATPSELKNQAHELASKKLTSVSVEGEDVQSSAKDQVSCAAEPINDRLTKLIRYAMACLLSLD